MEETEDQRVRRISDLVETYLHSAKKVAIQAFGPDAAHGHAEVITRIAQTMATLDAAEMIADKLEFGEDE